MNEDANIQFLRLMQRAVWGEGGQTIDVSVVACAEVDIVGVAFRDEGGVVVGEGERVGGRTFESACQEADSESLVRRIINGLRVIGVEGRADTRGAQLVFEGRATIGA